MFATASDGTELWYDSSPGPRPVLFLHGFASDHARTWQQTGWTRAVGDRGYVLTDLRGHGRSGRPTTGYSPENLAEDVLAVLNAVEVALVDVVTYSMGGLVGWALARLSPERISRLVVGGLGARPADREHMLRVRDALLGEQPDACIDGMAGHRPEGEPPVPVLVAAGDLDDLAEDAEPLSREIGAPFIALERRHHLNAVSSRQFKTAVLEFFDRDRA